MSDNYHSESDSEDSFDNGKDLYDLVVQYGRPFCDWNFIDKLLRLGKIHGRPFTDRDFYEARLAEDEEELNFTTQNHYGMDQKGVLWCNPDGIAPVVATNQKWVGQKIYIYYCKTQ